VYELDTAGCRRDSQPLDVIGNDRDYPGWNGSEFQPSAVLTLTAAPRLFARKFDETLDAEVLDANDKRLL
jgi:hypothetical protein